VAISAALTLEVALEVVFSFNYETGSSDAHCTRTPNVSKIWQCTAGLLVSQQILPACFSEGSKWAL